MRGFFGKHGRRKVNIPNLIGLSRTQAQTELNNRGFSYSESSTNTSDSNQSEKVESQTDSENSVKLYGETVTYRYYNYVAPYYNPYSNPPPYYNPYSNPPPYYNPYSNPPPYDNTYYNPYSNPPPYDNTYYNPYSNPPPYDNTYYNPYYNPYDNPPSGGGGGCFVFGTQVLMADGSYKNMEDLQVGDLICGADVPTLPDEEYPNYVDNWSIQDVSGISKITSTVTGKMYDMFTSYYKINNLINITQEHLILAKSENTDWRFISIESLNIGDLILDDNMQITTVLSKDLINESVQTINIDTEPKDVYFVKGLMAHNIICYQCSGKL